MDELKQVKKIKPTKKFKAFDLLFTSPSYLAISDYHRNQWLRLWMLGGKPFPSRLPDNKHRGQFHSVAIYTKLLTETFLASAELMSKKGCVYVRTDARSQTFNITQAALSNAFPKWKQQVIDRPYNKQTQTALYGDKSKKPGEKDIILTSPYKS